MEFDGSSELYTDLLNHREAQWKVCTAGCKGLAGIFARAQGLLCRETPLADCLISAAKAAMDLGTRGSNVVPRLYRCLEDSLSSKSSLGIKHIPFAGPETKSKSIISMHLNTIE